MNLEEKLETIDHLLYFTFKNEKDNNVLKSILEDLSNILSEIIDKYLIKLKEKKEIDVLPKMEENKLRLFIDKIKNKGFSEKEIEMMEILLVIRKNNLIKEKYSSFQDVEKFYKLIKKIYDNLL
jgi:hypothetical protein